jgi:hypothetical protein
MSSTKARALFPITAHLTSSGSPELDRAQQRTYVGQAHFAIGPECCSSCGFWGYSRVRRNAAGDAIGTQERKSACRRYLELAGRHGANVPGYALACRHYRKREG